MRTFKTIMKGLGLALLFSSVGFGAEPTYSVTFGASVTSSNETLSTALTWSSSPAGASCTASGHPSWTGVKAASGTLSMPVINLSGTYTLTMACNWPAVTQARLCWQAPTQNTDGSPIQAGSLGPYRIYQGTSATNLARVAEATGLCADRTGLATGTHYFAVTAVNTAGVESALSSVGSKTITGAVTRNSSVTLTVNPKPAAPGNLTVE